MSKKSKVIDAAVDEANAVRVLSVQHVKDRVLEGLTPKIERTVLEALASKSSSGLALDGIAARMVAEASNVNLELEDGAEVKVVVPATQTVDSVDAEVVLSPDSTSMFDEPGDDLFGDAEAVTVAEPEEEEGELVLDLGGDDEPASEEDDSEEGGEEEATEDEGLFDSLDRDLRRKSGIRISLEESAKRARVIREWVEVADSASDLKRAEIATRLLGKKINEASKMLGGKKPTEARLSEAYKVVTEESTKLLEALNAVRQSLQEGNMRNRIRSRRLNELEAKLEFEATNADEQALLDELGLDGLDVSVEVEFAEEGDDDFGDFDVDAELDELGLADDDEAEVLEEARRRRRVADARARIQEARRRAASARRPVPAGPRRVQESRRRPAPASAPARPRKPVPASEALQALRARRVNESRRKLTPIERRRLVAEARRRRRNIYESDAVEGAFAAKSATNQPAEDHGNLLVDVHQTEEAQRTPAMRDLYSDDVSSVRPVPAGRYEAMVLRRKLAQSKLREAQAKVAARIVANEGISKARKIALVEALNATKSIPEVAAFYKAARTALVESNTRKPAPRPARRPEPTGLTEAKRAQLATIARQRLAERAEKRRLANARQRVNEARAGAETKKNDNDAWTRIALGK